MPKGVLHFKYNFFKLLQFAKTSSPMLVTEFGKVKNDRPLHPLYL